MMSEQKNYFLFLGGWKMPSNYWDKPFKDILQNESIETIFEVGSRYGHESVKLSNEFPGSVVFSFECNPLTIEICQENLKHHPNITFVPSGLGEEEGRFPFYSYVKDNFDGPSSFLKRIDFEQTQRETGSVQMLRLDRFVQNEKIEKIDLLCMDVQGYEIRVLKGAGSFLKNVNYVIMEEPAPTIDRKYLPEGVHSKYINSHTHEQIKEFMTQNNFKEVHREKENEIEHNVMYKNLHFQR
jgi:FkbM family methyltransferase